MAVKTTAQLKEYLNLNINTNGINAITGAIMNTFLNDLIDSIKGTKATKILNIQQFQIIGINQGLKKIIIQGNATYLTNGRKFEIELSTGNNGIFTNLSAIILNESTTEIIVSETIPNATADGQINTFETFTHNLGSESYVSNAKNNFKEDILVNIKTINLNTIEIRSDINLNGILTIIL